MNSKLKKLSIALAGIMSAAAITAVVPAGTVGTLGSVATVAHADTEFFGYEEISTDTVYNDNVIVPEGSIVEFGTANDRCIIEINGNLTLKQTVQEDPEDPDSTIEGGLIYLNGGSLLIVNGDLTLESGSMLLFTGVTEKVIVTGNVDVHYGASLDGDYLVETSLQDITYVPANDNHYEYFTSGSKLYTLNGSTLVETTESAVSKTQPSTAEISVEDVDAYIDDLGLGHLRVISTVLFDGKDAEYYGAWFVPADLQDVDGKKAQVTVDETIESGDSFASDLRNIPAESNERSILVIPFIKLCGEESLATTSIVLTVSENKNETSR